MPVNKSSSKRMMYQQNENPNVRQKLKLLSDARGMKRQSILKPSNVDRMEGISDGGAKRGGKTFHSRQYRMIPTLYGEGRKIKQMESQILEPVKKGGMDRRPRRDTPPPQRPNTPEEQEQPQPRRGRPKKTVVKEDKPHRGKGKLKGGMEAEEAKSSSISIVGASNLLEELKILRKLLSMLGKLKKENKSYTNPGRKWLPADEQLLMDVIKQAKERKIKIPKTLSGKKTEKRGRPYYLEDDFLNPEDTEAEKRRRRRRNRARVVGEKREYFPEEEEDEDEDEDEDGDESPAGARGMDEEDESARGKGKLKITHYEGGARLLGQTLMKELMKDPQYRLMGKGFFDKLLDGAKEFAKGVALPVKVAGKLIGDVVPPLKMAGKVVEGIDDPKWLKELKGKGGRRGSPLQIENPNIRGNGFFDNFGLKKDFSKLGNQEKIKGSIFKNKGGKKRVPSDWINFVKKVQQDKGISYKEALKVASKLRK